jgi:hypothetical protein
MLQVITQHMYAHCTGVLDKNTFAEECVTVELKTILNVQIIIFPFIINTKTSFPQQ